MTIAARFDADGRLIDVTLNGRRMAWTVAEAGEFMEAAPRQIRNLTRRGFDLAQHEMHLMLDSTRLLIRCTDTLPLVAALAPALDAACRAGVFR